MRSDSLTPFFADNQHQIKIKQLKFYMHANSKHPRRLSRFQLFYFDFAQAQSVPWTVVTWHENQSLRI